MKNLCSPFSKFKPISIKNASIAAIIRYARFEFGGAFNYLKSLHFLFLCFTFIRIQLHNQNDTNITIECKFDLNIDILYKQTDICVHLI